MRYLFLLGVLLAVFSTTGCTTVTAVNGQQGKAYVVKWSPLGSSFWNCEAGEGKPKCYKVVKQ